MRALTKFFDAPRVRDRLTLFGGRRARKGGMTMADGSPVTVEHVQITFRCSKEYAEKFIREHA